MIIFISHLFRSTFGTIYKVLFVAMNDALASDVVQPSGTISRRRAVQEVCRVVELLP